MGIDLKTRVSTDGATKQAARRRVLDEPFVNATEKQIESAAVAYMRRTQQTYPRVVGGEVLNSFTFREFFKDGKFLVDVYLGRLQALGTEIENTTKQAFGVLNDIQREAAVLDSQLVEEELKLLKGFSKVHHNRWVRAIDFGRGAQDVQWKRDWKTGNGFLAEQQALVLPGRGCCLPLRDREIIPVIDVILVDEETDHGDVAPVVSTSPRNLLLSDRIFRHVIIRTEHDGVNPVAFSTSYCTVQLEFGGIQVVNSLTIKPVGHSVLQVEEVSYVDDYGAQITLAVDSFSLGTDKVLMFEPVRTKFMKVKLSTKVPVSKTKYTSKNELVHELNKALRGVGFSEVPEAQETISGRIYDFSLDSIVAHLYVFHSQGLYRSKGLKVVNPLGLILEHEVENLVVTKTGRVDGSGYVIPSAVANVEFYLGVDLIDADGNQVLHELVPLADALPLQREQLVVVGTDSMLKMFPDMHVNIVNNRIVKCEMPGSYPGLATVWTESPHGLLVGDNFLVYGSLDSSWNGTQTVAGAFGATAFKITVASSVYEITENTRPLMYLYEAAGQPAPAVVYADGVALTIGSDYQVSLNGGETWLWTWPLGIDYLRYQRRARTGLFRIRLVAHSFDSSYYISYTPLHKQRLGNSDKLWLINRRVVFKNLGNTHGNLSVVAVHRASTVVPYVSPIITKYTLKVREQ